MYVLVNDNQIMLVSRISKDNGSNNNYYYIQYWDMFNNHVKSEEFDTYAERDAKFEYLKEKLCEED